jgi:hypothetical protein
MFASKLLLPLAACFSVALAAGASPAPAPPQGTPEQVQTLQDMRVVGTAMWQWYKAEVAPKLSEKLHKAAEAHEGEPKNIGDIPVISREDLAKILVPKYIAAIPETDGWGHPYEFHLNASDPNAVTVFGLRSGGADGTFSGDVYEIAGFPAADTEQDLVWLDGFFMRWPTPAPRP